MLRAAFIVGVVLGISISILSPAHAADYNCVPLEVAVIKDPSQARVHVLCAELNTGPGNYPTDTGNAIQFFAVSLSADPGYVKRFIQTADIAITSGLTIRFSYNSGDYSGESFGC